MRALLCDLILALSLLLSGVSALVNALCAQWIKNTLKASDASRSMLAALSREPIATYTQNAAAPPAKLAGVIAVHSTIANARVSRYARGWSGVPRPP